MKNYYKEKTILELNDEVLHEISSDQWCSSEGCETCGYGSVYISELEFYFDRGVIRVVVNTSYNYSELTGTFFLKLIVGNLEAIKAMDFSKFFDFLTKKIKDESGSASVELIPYSD